MIAEYYVKKNIKEGGTRFSRIALPRIIILLIAGEWRLIWLVIILFSRPFNIL